MPKVTIRTALFIVSGNPHLGARTGLQPIFWYGHCAQQLRNNPGLSQRISFRQFHWSVRTGAHHELPRPKPLIWDAAQSEPFQVGACSRWATR